MAHDLDIERRVELIARRQTFLNPSDRDSLKALLENKEKLRIVWETTPTGKPHIGYFVPLAKLADFLRAGLEVAILYLDVYGFLVNYIHPLEVVQHRKQYYQHLMTAILLSLGIPKSQVKFIDESTYAYTEPFTKDMHKMCAVMTQQDARDTCDEVANTTMLSPMLCAIHQSLSEEYCDMDIQFGGEDQWFLFEHSVKFMPKIGYRKRLHVMNTMVSGLDGIKMSSSRSPDTKIEFLDDPETVHRKIQSQHCEAGNVQQNGILGILRDVLFPISEIRYERLLEQTVDCLPLEENQRPFVGMHAEKDTIFTIEDSEQGRRDYASYEAIEKDFKEGKISPAALKMAVTAALNSLLAPIRKVYEESEDWQAVDKLGYS